MRSIQKARWICYSLDINSVTEHLRPMSIAYPQGQ